MLTKRWFQLTILLACLSAGILIGTPFLIKHYAKQWLLENGGEQVIFEDIDFNPFTAALILKGLEVRSDSQATLSFERVAVSLSWTPLLDKKVAIERIELSGFHISIDDRPEDALLIGGIRIPDSTTAEVESDDTPATAWMAGIETLILNDIHIQYADRQLELTLDISALELGHLNQWTQEDPAHLNVSGSLNQAPFTLDAKLAPLATQPAYQGKLTLDGLPLDAFAQVAQSAVASLTGTLSYNGNFVFTQRDTGFHLKHEGDISLQALDTSLNDPELHITNTATNISGALELSSTDGIPDIKLTTDITAQDLHLVAREGTLELLSAETIQLTGLNLEATDKLAIESIQVDKLGLGRNADHKVQDAFIDVGHFEISSLTFSSDLLTIDSVHYKDGHSQIKRNADGKLRIIGIIDSMSQLSKQQQEAETTPAANTPGKDPLAIAINRIEVSGDSKISFLDQSVKPEFKIELKLDSMLVENLDTRKPEQHSNFKLAGLIGKYSSLNLDGYALPFQQPFGINLKSTIDALDLPPLTPYTRESLGLVLDSGALNADTVLVIDKQQMKGQIDLKLHQLKIETVESENSLQNLIPIPLNVALDTLRDSNDTITLKIPIKGDPNNPDFDPKDAINTALATGVKKGALTYLTFALQPYGALITAAKYAGEEINKVHLKPVEFDAGLTNIDAKDKDYLGKVAGILKDRPRIAIKLCGVAVNADKLYLQQQATAKAGKENKNKDTKPVEISEQQLAELARARADQVKDYLIKQFNTPASHLVSCRPRVATDNSDAQARTDLLI